MLCADFADLKNDFLALIGAESEYRSVISRRSKALNQHWSSAEFLGDFTGIDLFPNHRFIKCFIMVTFVSQVILVVSCLHLQETRDHFVNNV